MASNIKIKRSAVQNKVPHINDLELGEIALNTYDGKLFAEVNTGIATVVEIGSNLSNLNVSGVGTIVTVDATTVDAGSNLYAVSGVVTNFTSTNTNVTGIATISGLKYPIADGASGQALVTNGSGVLSFTNIQGGIDKHILPVMTRTAQSNTKNNATMVTISAGINTVIGRFGSNVNVNTNAFVIPRTVGITTQILIETFFNSVA
jgi:hypothetical protein